MSYKLKKSDPTVEAGVRRIAVAQFSDMLGVLEDPSLPPARRVHEVRKATKRVRALIRLVWPVFADARSENLALRDAARTLSGLRDQSAIREMLDDAHLGEELAGRLAEFLPQPDHKSDHGEASLEAFQLFVHVARARAETWTLSEDGFDACAGGLKRTYRRLRRSVAAALPGTDEEAVHEWRKRAKDHWYQTVILEGVFPPVMAGFIEACERQSEMLGRWRDLGLLASAIMEVPAHALPKTDVARALEILSSEREKALRKAARAGRRLTAENDVAYCERLRGWWHA